VQHPATHQDDQPSVEARLRHLLAETLGLPPSKVAQFGADTALFGALPEFDSMAVAHFLTGFEEAFDVIIEDDDVEAEDFATFGTLLTFAERLARKS
jgi:acyl carrier protein